MTREQAQAVRDMREHDEMTWRGVSAVYAERYPERQAIYRPGCQADGRMLCRQAAAVLGENPEDEPW